MSVAVGWSVNFMLKRGLMSVRFVTGPAGFWFSNTADAAEEERLVALQRPADLDGVVDELGDDRGVAERRVRGDALVTDVAARQRIVRVAQRRGRRTRSSPTSSRY